jgi:hypothetical protein
MVVAALVLLTMPAFAQLSGTYTIDPAGSGSTNYTTFSAAVSALTTSGVSGPVTFNVAAGTYNEQVTIGAITGTSATNTVTIQTNPSATSQAILKYTPTASTNYFTLKINGSSHVAIKNLNIKSGGFLSGTTLYGRLVEFGGINTNITFENNTFNGLRKRAGTNAAHIYGSGVTVDNLTIHNNTFNHGGSGVYISGSSTSASDNLTMTNNTFNGLGGDSTTIASSSYGLYAYNFMGGLVKNNVISFASVPAAVSYIDQYGIYTYGLTSATTSYNASWSVEENEIYTSAATASSYLYGIYLGYANGSTASPNKVINNMISFSGATSVQYGIYPYHCDNIQIYHNTISAIAGSATSSRAFYLNKSTSTTAPPSDSVDVRNNIISHTGLGYAIEVSSAAQSSIVALNNNAYNGNTTNPFRWGTTNYTTLGAWTTATTFDANSVFGNPVFVSQTNLHVTGAIADAIGAPLGVTLDIDGQTRSTSKPDAGADEFLPPPTCPTTDTVVTVNGVSCGNSTVTLSASSAGAGSIIWMNGNSKVVGAGSSFTTPVITSTQTYLSALYVDNNQVGPTHMGAPATLTGGFGNFTNGQWFTAQKAITIDSITVISNGASTFKVRISEAAGTIATGNSGALLQESQWITVGAAGTHKVAVGLKIMPGTYFMNFAWQTGSGLLHRATAGATYPYTIAGVASIDSVQFGSATSQVRVYYAYDWVVSEGCVGPNATATATWAAVPSTAIPYSVDFNGGLPCNWTKSSNTTQNWNVVSTYGTNSLNGSSFAFIDDDAAGGSAAAVDASLISPLVNTLGYDSVTVSFDHYFYSYTGTAGYVEVYNGTAWVAIDTLTTTQGSWTAPAAASYDVTAFANANFQVRLRYNDGTGAWGWYWAVDNFEIDGNVLPCTNVRVAITTDIYGSEVSWSIRDVNTGIVWATGGPYADVTPYNAAAATHIDTLCLPDNGTYEFQINDSFGDGLTDGTNTGTYAVDKLCSWGWNNVITGSGALPYGSTTAPPSKDSAVFDMNCIQLKNVTFQVDMNQVTAGFTTPEVNGFWNNWCGNCNAMSDANGDGIWEVTIPLEVGTTQEFKYSADAWTIQEMNDPTAPCTNGNATYTNRVLVVPAADTTLPVVCWSSCYGCTVDVTLQVNMAWEVANNAISADGIHVAGDFQGWNPGATAMTDANSDGIYEVTINVPANSSIQYKFINGNAWGQDEPVPGACAVTGTTNRGATFAYGDSTMAPVCFGKCTDCMASLDETLQNVSLFPNPTRGQFNLARMDAASEVEVSVLDLQGKVLTVATWNAGAESLGIDLSNFANGVYMVRLTSEEGSRTLRVSVQK